MSEILLTITDVSKQFSHIEALKRVNLTLNRGDIVGLVGGNGAGKTTLLRLMCGLYHPTQGQVLFHGDSGPAPVAEMR